MNMLTFDSENKYNKNKNMFLKGPIRGLHK